MLLLNNLRKKATVVSVVVSILVFMDVAFEFKTRLSSSVYVSKFQSLFLWMLLLNIIFQKQKDMATLRFNPCFYGCCFWIRNLNSKRFFHAFVSILVFMDVAFELSLVLIYIYYDFCFNPCFYGCCFWISVFPVRVIHLQFVSILVFMDVAFEFSPVWRSATHK